MTETSCARASTHELDEIRAARSSAWPRRSPRRSPGPPQILLDGDLEGADYLILADDEIDARALDLEERCYRVLALQAPVASDLRQVVAAVKIDRRGRALGRPRASTSARRRAGIYGHELDPQLRGIISRDGRAGPAAVHARRSTPTSRTTRPRRRRSTTWTTYSTACSGEFVQAIFESHAAGRIDLQVAVQLAVVARFYERIGDHAVNIGERVRYMVTGWLPEHDGAARYRAQRGDAPESEAAGVEG